MHCRAEGVLVLAAAAVLVAVPFRANASGEKSHVESIRPMSESQNDTLTAIQGAVSSDSSVQTQYESELPGTGHRIGRHEIEQLPVRGAEEVTALQAGVVLDRRTNDLYLRGGGSSELIYYVDGVPVQNAFTGRSSARLSNAAIDEISVTTGSLGVDYGWGMSGVTNVRTIDGGQRLHGAAETITDNFHGERYDYNLYGLSLNGPLLPNSDQVTFSFAGEHGWMGDRQPHSTAAGILPHNSSGTWTWNGKLRWKPTETLVARLGAFGSRDNWKIYLPEYHFDIAHAPRSVDRNSGFWGEISHNLSPRTFYTLRGYWTSKDSRLGDGVYFDDLWGYGRPNGNPRYDATTLFWAWDDMQLDPDSLAIDVQYQLRTPVQDTVITVTLPNGTTVQKGFVAGGDEGRVWNDYVRRQGSYVGGQADWVSRFGENHYFKIGGEFQRHTLRYYHHLFPTEIYQGKPTGFRDVDYYGFDELGSEQVDSGLNAAKHPISLAGYVQDRLVLSDLVISAGIRLDYLDYATRRLRNPSTPLDPDGNLDRIETDTTLTPHERDSLTLEAGRLTESDLAKSKTLVRVSPRLGASFKMPAGPLIHFSFGRYFQRPDFGTLYSNFGYLEYKIKTGGYSAIVGNGGLKPPGMTSLELGVEQRITDFLTSDITGFYKDISDLIGIITQPASPNSYATYANVGDVTSKGLEFQIEMKRTCGLAGELKYTIQSADAGSLPFNSQSNIAWTVASPGHSTGPIGYDRRHTFIAIIDARLADKGGPKIGSFYPLEQFGVNLVFNAASGFPYTPTRVYPSVFLASLSATPAGPYNSSRVPATYRLDLKADKAFSVGGTTLDFYLWALNVFNRANVLDVYSGTGKPDDTGWLNTPEGQSYVSNTQTVTDSSRMTGEQKYRFRENDPTFYDTPRQIRLGMTVSF